MASLKAGSVDNFSNSMAAEIEAAMQDEWQTVKGKPLPAPLGREDRRILFVAIARGVLKYLHDHQIDIGTNSVNAGGVGDTHSHHLDFDGNDT